MADKKELDRFRDLTFEDFGRMAKDDSLQPHEKIGFPSVFREGFDSEIFEEIKNKIDWQSAKKIADIGCGCGELTNLILRATLSDNKSLVLVDSAQVLSQLQEQNNVQKVPGRFPDNFDHVKMHGTFDVVICYSVFHYIFNEVNVFRFIENCMELLSPGGRFLLGDIPNLSKRNRFLLTPAGERFHQKLMNTTAKPEVHPHTVETGKIDDGIIFGLLSRYRNMGIETYLLPQSATLPLANSREDILFVKPR